VTSTEAAAIARRHRVTIRAACANGELHGIQRVPNGNWLIPVDCIDPWMLGDLCDHLAKPRKLALIRP
jgi:hypothetical protein